MLMKKDLFFAVTDILIIFSTIAPRCKLRMQCNVVMFSKFIYTSGITLLSIAFVGGKGLLCCKCKYIVHIIELSYVLKLVR